MLFFLLMVAGFLFLVPASIVGFAFFAASVDYLLAGGSAATTTDSNARSETGDPRPECAEAASISSLLEIE